MAGIGLYIQLLEKQSHKVLAAACIASAQTAGNLFSSADVQTVFDTLRVPAPSNVPAHMALLAKAQLVVRDARTGKWALTPLGRERAMAVLGDHATTAAQAAEVEKVAEGALLADTVHPVIPPGFAPPRWREGIRRLLERFPFETNVFCMTRFPDDEGRLPDPVVDCIPAIRSVCESHGLTLHLASDRIVDEELFGNVGAYMWACRYGIGILEDRVGRGLNYNVTTELGAMLVIGRRCAILRDATISAVPTDISGHIYKPVDLADLDQVAGETERWIVGDLGLGDIQPR